MNDRTLSPVLVARTPAKLNLFLEVLRRRGDGFHELVTLMVPVSLFDTLTFRATAEGPIELACQWSAGLAAASATESAANESLAESLWEKLPQGASNIVVKALERLREGASVRQGAQMSLSKRIPAAAGLGGASSDAAAALLVANRAWGLDWSRERLSEVAAEVGSDVPFFLWSRPAVCRGRGERIEPVEGLPPLHVVIVKPPVGLPTPDVFRGCRSAESLNEEPREVDTLIEPLRRGDWSSAGRCLFNRLEPAARKLSSWIDRVLAALANAGAVSQGMSGSGSSCFGLCRSEREARRVAGRLRAQRLGAVFQATTAVSTMTGKAPGTLSAAAGGG